MDKQTFLKSMHGWINQKPGLDGRNYDTRQAYRSEEQAITQARRDALELLSTCAVIEVTYHQLTEACEKAFSGRLSWDGTQFQYITGQYWPTEYRRAACAVLAMALRHHLDDAKRLLPKAVYQRWV